MSTEQKTKMFPKMYFPHFVHTQNSSNKLSEFFQEKLKNVALTEDQEHYQRDFFAMLEVLFDKKIVSH